MAISLETLTTRLTADVPSRNDVPSADQYERAVQVAVADYSQRKSLRRFFDVAVVAGTGTYTLPADFLRSLGLEGWGATPTGVLNTAAGLVPVSAGYEEVITFEDGTMTIEPTPTYTMTRRLWYKAGHVLDEIDAYPLMDEADAGVILLRAQALALRMQANVAVQEAWKYSEGDEAVDKTQLAKAMQDQAKALDAQYEAGLKQAIGAVVRAYPSMVR